MKELTKSEEQKKNCYICEEDIEFDEDPQAIPFKEDGMIVDMWYAHQKCYNEDQIKEIKADYPEYYEDEEDEAELMQNIEITIPVIKTTLKKLKSNGLTKDDYITLIHRKVRNQLSRTKLTIVINAILAFERKTDLG